jgi:hypothetical protein
MQNTFRKINEFSRKLISFGKGMLADLAVDVKVVLQFTGVFVGGIDSKIALGSYDLI